MKPINRFLQFILWSFILLNSSQALSRHPLIQYYDGEINLTPTEVDSLSSLIITNRPSAYLLSLAFYQRGILEEKQGNDINAFQSYLSSLDHLIDADTSDHYLLSAIRRNQGFILHNYKLYNEAVNLYQEALEPAYLYSIKRGRSTEYNIGFSMIQYDPENALKLFLNLMDKAKGDTTRIARIYNQIGLFQKRSENYQQAINYFNQGLDLGVKGRDKANLLQNLADTYYHQKDYSKQEAYLFKTLEIPQANKFIAWMDLGECYILQDRHQEAKRYLLKAEMIYEKQPLNKEYIKLFTLLQVLSDEPLGYAQKQIDELGKYVERMDLLKEKMETLAMKNMLSKIEADRSSKKEIHFLSCSLFWGL